MRKAAHRYSARGLRTPSDPSRCHGPVCPDAQLALPIGPIGVLLWPVRAGQRHTESGIQTSHRCLLRRLELWLWEHLWLVPSEKWYIVVHALRSTYADAVRMRYMYPGLFVVWGCVFAVVSQLAVCSNARNMHLCTQLATNKHIIKNANNLRFSLFSLSTFQ